MCSLTRHAGCFGVERRKGVTRGRMVGRRRRGDDRCVDSDEEWPWRVGGRVGYGRGLPSLSLSLPISFFLSVYVSDLPVHIWGAANSSLLTSPSIATAGKTMEGQSHRNVMKQCNVHQYFSTLYLTLAPPSLAVRLWRRPLRPYSLSLSLSLPPCLFLKSLSVIRSR